MVLVQEQTSLVLVGIWNPAILNPEWLIRNALGVPAGTEVSVEMLVAATPSLPTQYAMQGLRFTPTRDRLTIHAVDAVTDAVLVRMQSVALQILQLLPHTPVRACGQNFTFLEEHPSPEQVGVFGAVNDVVQTSDFPLETSSTGVRLALQFEGRLLNFTRTLQGGKLELKMNFHAQVKDANTAIDMLKNEGLFAANLSWAKRILKNLYGVEL